MDEQQQDATVANLAPTLPVMGTAGLTPTLTPTGASMPNTPPLESTTSLGIRKALDAQSARSKNATNASLFGAVQQDPDGTARLQALARKLGVPTGTVALDEERANVEQKLREIRALNLAENAPNLSKLLGDPEFANIAYDDLQPLSRWEQLFDWVTDTSGVKAQAVNTMLQTEESKFWVRMMNANMGSRQELSGYPEEQKRWDFYMSRPEDPIDSLAEGAAYLGAQLYSTADEVASYAVAGGLVGGAVGAAGGLGIGSMATAPTGAAVGMSYGAGIGMFTSMSKLEAGLLYKDLLRNEVDPDDARVYAMYAGMGMGALEFASFKMMSAPLRASLKAYMKKEIAKRTMKGAVGTAVKGYAQGVGAEIGTELLQENLSIATEEASRRFSKGKYEPLFTWDGGSRYLQRMGDVAQQTFTTVALFGGLGPSAKFAVDYANVRQTERTAAFLNKVANTSKDSKLRARAPNAFLEYLAKQSEGKPAETMYVNAERLREILRKSELTGGEIDQALPGVRAKLEETLTSADIEIPTAQFATTAVGTVLEQPILMAARLDPKAHSVEQLIALQAEQVEYLKDAEATLIGQVETNANAVVEAEAVHTAAKVAFVAAGREETQAHADAMFYRAYIIRLAGELNISVAEAAGLFPLPTIVGVGQAAAASTLAPARFSGAVATTPAAAATATTNAAEALPPVSPVTAESLREVATANVASTTATMQQVRDNAVAERRLTSSQLKANEAGEAAVQQWIRENKAAYARFKADRDFVAGKSEAPSSETSEQERARVGDASDTLEQAAKPDRSTNQPAIPTTVDDAANLAAAQAIASSKSWDTGRNLKLALQESVLAAANNAGVDPSLVSPQRLEYLIRIGTADALKALADNKEAVGWYDAKCMEALAIAALIYPELKTNANARFAYIWALAVTSNGMKVDMNFQLADSVFKYFKKNNEFPTNITAGQAQKNINKSLAAFNLMRKEFGIDNLRQFMQTEMTLKQVNALAGGDLKASGEHAGTLVNGSAILGPKIGNGFFSNLYGRFDKLTMDRWLVRTWGRWTGTLIEIDQPLLNKARERMAEVRTKVNASASERTLVLDVLQDVLAKKEFKERKSLITQLKALAKLKKPKAAQLEKMVELRAQIAAFGDLDQLVIDRFASVSDDAFAIAIQKQSQDQTRRANLSKTDIGNEVRLAANSLAKYADGQKEAPSGPFERQDIREVFEGMLANLQKDARYSNLTMADLQAVLWYAEKRLYENAKEDTVAGEREDAYEPDEAPDYSNASAKVARERGITNEQINAAIKEAHDERARKQKTQAMVRAEGDKSGSTESGERGSGRVERTGSESERTSALVEAASKIVGGFTPKELVTFQRDVATRGARRISQYTKGQSAAYYGKMVGDAGGVRRLTAFGGTARTVWAADAALTKVWTPVGTPSLELFELEPTIENASAFADLIAKARVAHKFGMSVTLYPVADYAGMRLFVTENGAAGFALKPDGDIISAFSNGGNAAAAMLQTAVAAGGTKLDAFDTVLPDIYASHGFRAVARVKWDDAEAPEGWDKALYRDFNGGEPDVVMMVLDRDYFGWYVPANGSVPADGLVMSYPDAVAEQIKQQAQLNQPRVEESTTFQQEAFAEQPWGHRSQIRDESGELETVYHGTSQTADQTGFFTNDKNDGTNFDETADESDWDAAVAEVNRAHKQIALLMSPAQHALWEQVFGETIAEYVVTKDALSDDAQETGQPMEAMDNARDSVIEVIKPDADLLASIIARFDRAKKEAGITQLTGATVMPVNLDVVYPLIVEVPDTQQFDEIKTVALAEMDVYVHDGIVFNMPDASRVYFVPTEEQVQPAASTFFQQDAMPTFNFKNWFKESKAVDKNGAPLKVHHGSGQRQQIFRGALYLASDITNAERRKLDKKGKGFEGQFFFSTKQSVAETYMPPKETTYGIQGRDGYEYEGGLSRREALEMLENDFKAMRIKGKLFSRTTQPNTRSFFLSVQNPLVIEGNGRSWNQLSRKDLPKPIADRMKSTGQILGMTGFGSGPTEQILDLALEFGYDGVLFRSIMDTGPQGKTFKEMSAAEKKAAVSDVWAVGDSRKIKSTRNKGGFNPEVGSTLYQNSVAPAPAKFFSNLTRVVSTVPLDNASAGNWMKLFKKLAGQGTIRNDEIEWTFLEEWLDAQVGLVSRDSVLDFLEKNGVEIEVSPLVGQPKPVIMENKWVVEQWDEVWLGPFETESEAIKAVAEKAETLALNQYDEEVRYIRRRAKDAGGSDQDSTGWVIEGDKIGEGFFFNTEEEAKNWLMEYFRNDAANWAETVNIVQRDVPQVNRKWRVHHEDRSQPYANVFSLEREAEAFVQDKVNENVLKELLSQDVFVVEVRRQTTDGSSGLWTISKSEYVFDLYKNDKDLTFESIEEAEDYLLRNNEDLVADERERFAVVEEFDEDPEEPPLKYTRWQLGESQVNSQEVLITLPNAHRRQKGFINKDFVDKEAQREKVGNYYDDLIDKEFLDRQDLRRNGPSDFDERLKALGEADRRIKALQRKRRYEQNKILRKNPSTSPTFFSSTHWDALNVLVHIRTNDRVDAQGRRILFIEEIQSDSGQTGHKEGFYFPWFNNVEVSPTEFKVTDVDDNHYTVQNIKTGVEAVYFDMVSETDALETAAEDAMARASLPKHTGVMRMPFIESTGSWVTLALKQILLQAVNGNYDGVSFIDGKESSERYTLSRFVESVRVFGNADGTWNLEITALQANDYDQPIIEKRNNLTADKLELHVGAELAKLMIARQGKPETSDTGQETHVYDGDNLKLINKGMVKFYDEVVPSMTNKLSSKFGGGKLRAGEVMVDGSEYAILTLDLTQSLKAQVSNGLPLFQSTAGIPPRGEFDPIKNLMKLSNKADSSTVMHEMAHWFLVTTMNAALNPAASVRMLEDADMTLKWFGIAGATASERLANWHSMSMEKQRKYHESFAYNFEIYLYTGKAPSVELQTTFDKFRVWLANVYASIRDDLNALYRNRFGEDLPFLNEEVRGVFDRLIASEEQISRREEVDNFKASYESQEESGMSDAEWFEFKRLEKEAHDQSVAELTAASLKTMGTLSNGRGRMLASLQAKFNSTRRRIRREVLEAMALEPVRVAERFLKYGIRRNVDGVDEKTTSPYKLSRFAPGIDVDKLRRMISKEGVAPDLIADSLGYSSGDELVKAMNALPPMDEEADARTDARMTAEYGELNTPEARETAVDQAMHSEARGRFVAVEFQFLAKVSKPVATILAGAKEIARTILGKTKIKDIKPHNHALAEARVAREKRTAQRNMQSPETAKKTATTRSYNKQVADGVDPVAAKAESERVGEDAFARATKRHAAYEKENGVRPEVAAIKASHQQVIQHQLAREAQEIRDEVDSALRKFKKIFQADAKLAKGRNMALVMTARTILAHYELGRRGVMPAEYLEQLKEYNPELHAQVVQLTQGAENASRPYKELTVTEFRIMRDAVLALWQQSQRDQMMLVEGRLMRRDDAVKQLVARLYEIRQSDEVPGTTAALSANDLRKQTLLGLSALLKIPESWAYTMDGLNKNMPFTRFIFRPIRAAVDEYDTAVTVHITKFRDIITAWRGDGIEVRKIHSDELNYTFGSANGGLAKVEIVGALMHTGNASNYRKLLLGRGWATLDEEGNLDSSRWDAFVQRMIADGVITKRDYDFVQSVWDLNEEVKPIAQKAHYTMYGYYFQEVEATPFTNEFGTYRGGYVPAKTESTMARDALRHATAEELASDFRQEIPSTTRGFTKSRVEYNQPLSLDVGLMPSHLTSVLRFAIIQPAITDVLRLIKDESFKSKMNTVDRAAIDRILIPWLSRVATQRKTTAGIYPAVDAFWAGVRRNAGQSIMFANIRNALQQLTGLSPSLTRVKHRYLYAAIANYMANPNASAGECARLSPFMEQRLNSQMFELTEQIETALANPSAYDNIKTWFAKHSYFLQTAMQSPVDVITWWGKYNEVIAEAPLGADPEQTKAEAINQASATVRMTQGALDSTSVSSSQVGSPFYQTLIQFSSWGNMMANLNAANYVRIARDMGFRGNAGLLLHQYVFGFLAIAVVCEIMVKGLSGKLGDDDDDGYLDTVFDTLIGSQFRLGSSFVPGGGGATSLMMSGFTDAQWDDRMSSSPSVSALESSWKATDIVQNILDPKKEITGKNVNDVATLVSLITSIPAKGFARPISYLVDVNRGAVEPTSSIDFARGLVTGSASPASKDK